MIFRPCLQAGLLGAHGAKRKRLGVGRSLPALGPRTRSPGRVWGCVQRIPSAECNVMSKRMPVGLSAVDQQEQIYIQRCAACPSSRRFGWQPLLGWPRGRGKPARLDTAGTSPLLVRRTLLEHFLVTRSNSPEKVNCEVKA